MAPCPDGFRTKRAATLRGLRVESISRPEIAARRAKVRPAPGREITGLCEIYDKPHKSVFYFR